MGLSGPPEVAKLKAKEDVPGLVIASLGNEAWEARRAGVGVEFFI